MLSFQYGFPDLFVDNNSVHSSKVLKEQLSPGKEKLKISLSKTFNKTREIRKLIKELKITLNIKSFINQAKIQSKQNELNRIKAINEQHAMVDRKTRQDLYDKITHATKDHYASKIAKIESEVETFTKDLYNMMDGIESEVAEKAKKDHMEKISVLNLEIKDIEMNDLRIRNELTEEKQRVQELELQLKEEYLKMKKALEIKKKSEHDRDVDRSILSDFWNNDGISERRQYEFLEKVVNRAPSTHRFRPLIALWTNEEEKIKAKYAPSLYVDRFNNNSTNTNIGSGNMNHIGTKRRRQTRAFDLASAINTSSTGGNHQVSRRQSMW